MSHSSEIPHPIDAVGVPHLSTAQWGMLCFLIGEASFFLTLVMAYLTFLGQDQVGPTPATALSLPIVLVSTACLLLSSWTAHRAEAAFVGRRRNRFLAYGLTTLLLGAAFLALTALEWHDLIYHQHLTISRNLFGTTYFTLVGFHALHVLIGLAAMSVVGGLVYARHVTFEQADAVRLTAWYWHFVDAVWVLVFTVVYVVGR